jgi:D-arabinitol dehydrogenase (NADP+)
VICPEEQVYKISTTTTLEQAVLAEPLSCLAHGWDIISPVTIGDKILLLGAGIVGILWACALHLQGHKNVTVSEPNTARLDMLRKLSW